MRWNATWTTAATLFKVVHPSLLLGVQIDLEKVDHDHQVSPDERFRLAMARQ
jgi:hypothetical protein